METTTKKTLAAVLLTWLVTRALRRLIGVAIIGAVLTTGLVVAGRHGLDVSGVGRVVHCETRALGDVAKQMRRSSSSSSPSSGRRELRALRRVGACARRPAPRTARHNADRASR